MSDTMTFKDNPKQTRGRPDRKAAETTTRRRRTEIDGSMRGPLSINTDRLDTDEFVYRWISDDPESAVRRVVEDDWDLVDNDEKNPHASLGDDTKIRRRGGMVLARKRKEFYEEDQAAKERVMLEKDQQIRRGGDAAQELGASGYIPDEAMRFS